MEVSNESAELNAEILSQIAAEPSTQSSAVSESSSDHGKEKESRRKIVQTQEKKAEALESKRQRALKTMDKAKDKRLKVISD